MDDDMEELVAFWRARLDEDEAAALSVERVPGSAWPGWHDPARVLRDVEADRKLLADYEVALAAFERQLGGREPGGMPAVIETPDGFAFSPEVARRIIEEVDPFVIATATTLKAAVQYRAAIYRDHLDYRPEWAA